MTKSINTRIESLEKPNTPQPVKIEVDWGSDPDHSRLKAGDKIVTWGEEDLMDVKTVGGKI